MANQDGLCIITGRDSSRSEKDKTPNHKRISVVCSKPDHEVCAGYSAIPDISVNPSCMIRIVNYLRRKTADNAVDEITIDAPSLTRIYNSSQATLLKEVSSASEEIHAEINGFKQWAIGSKCQNSQKCSRTCREFFQKISDEKTLTGDPIRVYISILAQKRSWTGRRRDCLKCSKALIDLLERLRRVLAGTTLVSKFLELKLSYDQSERETIYNHFFQCVVIPRLSPSPVNESAYKSRKVEERVIGPYTVKVLVNRCSGENTYVVSSMIDRDSTLGKIVAEATSHLRRVPQTSSRSPRFFGLDELLQTRQREALRVIRESYPEIPEDVASPLAKLSSYESTGIGAIAPFLIDDEVEEFYIDQPGASVYLDHRNWGRCRTNIAPAPAELKRIETRLRAESGFRLDRLNPSIKTEISTKEFAVRASLDISPLAVDGFHLDTRKVERNRFSLAALVKNGTLSLEAAAYLYFCILRRRNIVAIGEPGSGKTTLINALDLLTPSRWRKISVEDTIESIPQGQFRKHQVRLKVEPFEERKRFLSKGREIVSLLHRTPDFIYLGEIQTASHSKAMFHALSAGLSGLQTCHAESPEQAMVRWVIHHRIPPICLLQIGVVVHMKKVGISAEGIQGRKVVRICEVKGSTDNEDHGQDFSSTSVRLLDIFRWNPSSASLDQKIDLFETPSLQSIREYESLSKLVFEEEMGRYRSALQTLAKEDDVSIGSTTNAFEEISKTRDASRDRKESGFFLEKCERKVFQPRVSGSSRC